MHILPTRLKYQESTYNQTANWQFVGHLNLWYPCTHENWYPMNNNEFTVVHFGWIVAEQMFFSLCYRHSMGSSNSSKGPLAQYQLK